MDERSFFSRRADTSLITLRSVAGSVEMHLGKTCIFFSLSLSRYLQKHCCTSVTLPKFSTSLAQGLACVLCGNRDVGRGMGWEGGERMYRAGPHVE